MISFTLQYIINLKKLSLMQSLQHFCKNTSDYSRGMLKIFVSQQMHYHCQSHASYSNFRKRRMVNDKKYSTVGYSKEFFLSMCVYSNSQTSIHISCFTCYTRYLQSCSCSSKCLKGDTPTDGDVSHEQTLPCFPKTWRFPFLHLLDILRKTKD